MSSVFVRVTVVGPVNQVDASLPSEQPIVDWLASLMVLAGLDPESHADIGTWELSDPGRGVLGRETTLASHGVLDGETLYLTEAHETAQAPFVDDVLAAVEHVVDAEYQVWRGDTRNRIVGYTVLGALTATIGLLALASLSWLAVGAGICIGILALVCGRMAQTYGAGHVAWAVIPAFAWAGAAAGSHTSTGTTVSAAIAAACLGVALASALGLLGGLVTGWTSAAVAACVGLVAVASAVGASDVGIAAWSLAPLTFALGYAPTSALTSGGLIALVRGADDGELANRHDIKEQVHSSRVRVDTLVATLSTLIGLALLSVGFGGIWIQGLLAPYVALVLAIHSRTFVHARHVAPVLAAAAAGTVAFVVNVPRWLNLDANTQVAVSSVLAALLAIAALLIGLMRLNDVSGARVARLLDTVAIPLTLGVVPMVFLAQGVYHYFWP